MFFEAKDYRKHLNLPEDYTIDSFIVYGTYKKHPFDQFEDSIKRMGYNYEMKVLNHPFFSSLVEYTFNKTRCWVAIAYGGALLSEYTHLACLFGSKKNILVGSCGGLKKGIKANDIIVPTYSDSNDSSAQAYVKKAGIQISSDESLSTQISDLLSANYSIHRDKTITYQAMMAETWGDIKNWSSQNYIGVEMEAATVFAVSQYFEVPAAAVLLVGDNLIEKKTILDINYENDRENRRTTSQDIFNVVVQVVA